MKIQIKILYGPDYERCKTTVLTKEFSSMTLNELSNMVSKVVGGFFDGEDKLRLQYRDDEGTYVTMNKQSDISDAAQLSSPIPQNDELLRVCLRVDNDFTPTSQHHEAPAKKRQCRLSEYKRQLSFISPCPDLLELVESKPKAEEEPVSSTESCNNREFQSPMQRYFKKMESDLESKKAKLRELKAEDEEIQNKLSLVKSNASDGNMCRSCHLRLGHTARCCTYGKCQSVFCCGEEKLHPGELNTKQLRSNIQKIKNEIMCLERNITQQQGASNQIKQSLTNRIEESLLQGDECKYFSNGHKNWPLLRRHVYLIEDYCKKNLGGKIPPKHKLSEILSRALNERQTNTTSSCTTIRQTKSKGNPTKQILESHGVHFPSSETTLERSSIYRCAPDNEDEEQEQLDMVIKQSMLDCPKTSTELRPTIIYQPVYSPAFGSYSSLPNIYNPFLTHSIGEQSLSISHDKLIHAPSMAVHPLPQNLCQNSK